MAEKQVLWETELVTVTSVSSVVGGKRTVVYVLYFCDGKENRMNSNFLSLFLKGSFSQPPPPIQLTDS